VQVERLLNESAVPVDAALECARGLTPLHIAAVSGSLSVAQALLDAGSAQLRDIDGQTPLHAAASAGEAPMAALLIRAGADPNALDAHAWAPLRWAALNGHADVVRVLLGADARADAAVEGLTPLSLAGAAGNLEVMAALCDAGLRDPSAAEVAAAAGQASVVAELLQLVHERSLCLGRGGEVPESREASEASDASSADVPTIDADALATARRAWDDAFRSSTPVRIRGVGRGWSEEVAAWSLDELTRRWGQNDVSVACSPDAEYQRPVARRRGDGTVGMVLREVPVRRARFGEFVELLRARRSDEHCAVSQSASDDAFAGFEGLPAVPPPLRPLLPERVNRCNLWVCAPPKLSALHYDTDDSVLVQIRGTKRFTLIAPEPLAGLTAYPTVLPVEALERRSPGVFVAADASPRAGEARAGASADGDAPARTVTHFPLVNASFPDLEAHPLFRHARVTTVDVREGEALLLPAFWYHEVQSFAPKGSLNIAINYWFDAEGIAGAPSRLHRILRSKLVCPASPTGTTATLDPIRELEMEAIARN